MRQFAAVEWERAQRALSSARQLVQTDPDSAASRAYYAAFHGMTAFDIRETGDYGGAALVEPASAQLAIEKAESFLAALRDACPELGAPTS
ncbi:MAG: hypothetical protein ACE15C_21365 [Phycisphaerae bacterium]